MSDKLYVKLREFHAMTQHQNWDLKGSNPMNSALWTDIYELCMTGRELGFDDPWVTPQANGSVELAWNLPRGRVISIFIFYESHIYPWTIYNKEHEAIEWGSESFVSGMFDKLFHLFPAKAKAYAEKNKENE